MDLETQVKKHWKYACVENIFKYLESGNIGQQIRAYYSAQRVLAIIEMNLENDKIANIQIEGKTIAQLFEFYDTKLENFKERNQELTKEFEQKYDQEPIEGLPKFKGNLDSKIELMVEWMEENIPKILWDNEEIEHKFARRGARQILTEGNVFYMNPCLDLTLLTLQILKENGYETTMIIETVKDHNYPYTCLHFAIELDNKGKTYFLDYNSLNFVVFGEGEYRNSKTQYVCQQVGRINGKSIGSDDNIFEILGPIFTIEGWNFDDQINKLKKDNTSKKYIQYLKRTEEFQTYELIRPTKNI